MDEEAKNDLIEQRIREINRALSSAKTPAHIKKLLKGTIRNVAWLEMKLDEARASIPEGEILKEYDNGGGQKGIQKSPALKAFEELFRDYTGGMDEIMNAISKEGKEAMKRRTQKAEPKNAFEKVKARQKDIS